MKLHSSDKFAPGCVMKTFRLGLWCAALLFIAISGVFIPATAYAMAVSTARTPLLFDEIAWFPYSAIFLCVALPLVPIIAYSWAGWEAKRNDITDGVSAQAKRCYLMMFSLSDYQKSQQATQSPLQDAISETFRCEKIFANLIHGGTAGATISCPSSCLWRSLLISRFASPAAPPACFRIGRRATPTLCIR